MARRVDCNVILKYCEILDEFIKVRVFNEEDLGELLQVKSIPNKRAYQQLVVNASVVGYHDDVLPLFKKINRVYKSDALEELLYQICVEVNPHLEIHQVALPLDGESEAGSQLHLLEAPSLQNQKESRRSLARMHQELNRRVIGQPEAIESVMRSIRKAAAGLKDPQRPVGVFLLIGQTGTGKTELAKMVARHVFGDPQCLVRIDCSEYALPHEYSKLIGAPPGYVGHNEGGHLTESMRERRSAVVLFDEIEKAHSKVHNVLLQIMDEGFLTDNKGGRVHFNQSVILLTSNVGVEELERLRNRMGFGGVEVDEPLNADEARDATLEAMRASFRPEFINRLDGVLVFNPLSERDCVRIARNQLDIVRSYLDESGIDLHITPVVAQRIAQLGYHPEFGARELRRTIQVEIEDALSESILDGRFRSGDRVRVRVRGRRFLFERERPRRTLAKRSLQSEGTEPAASEPTGDPSKVSPS